MTVFVWSHVVVNKDVVPACVVLCVAVASKTVEEVHLRTDDKSTKGFRVSPAMVLSAMQAAGFDDPHLVKGNIVFGALRVEDKLYDQVMVVLEERSVRVELLEHKHAHDPRVALNFVNAWNREKQFSTAFVDAEGDIRLQAEDPVVRSAQDLQDFFLTCRVSVMHFHEALQQLAAKAELRPENEASKTLEGEYRTNISRNRSEQREILRRNLADYRGK
eukprot:g73144.t1